MKHNEGKHGTIAFITTPQYRITSQNVIKNFIYRRLYTLCNWFKVLATGGSYEFIRKIVQQNPGQDDKKSIEAGAFPIMNDADLDRWRGTIYSSLKKTDGGIRGMIHTAYELVEGRLDAVIHFTDWEDKSAKPDSAVLSREANVHDVPIATDPDTASAYIESWQSLRTEVPPSQLFRERQKPKSPPLKDLDPGHDVLAMIAHNNKKLDMCRFAVEHAQAIFDSYDFVLATGTTGTWIKKSMKATGRSESEVERIRCCNSGPEGGDLQIAYAVVKDICDTVIFLQDPLVSHPHDADIRLFEQAVADPDVHAELATNVASARLLILNRRLARRTIL